MKEDGTETYSGDKVLLPSYLSFFCNRFFRKPPHFFARSSVYFPLVSVYCKLLDSVFLGFSLGRLVSPVQEEQVREAL